MSQEKRPRHYAADILARPTKEERRAALAAVPDPLRHWVEHYVRDHYTKKRNKT